MKDRKSTSRSNFLGVFPKDTLPDVLKENESLIINLDDFEGDGTHWTCIFNRGQNVEYFDSYGMPPPDLAIKFMKTTNKRIAFSTSVIQMPNSILCGYYCMFYITERENGLSMYDIIYLFDQDMSNNTSCENQNIIKKYFNII